MKRSCLLALAVAALVPSGAQAQAPNGTYLFGTLFAVGVGKSPDGMACSAFSEPSILRGDGAREVDITLPGVNVVGPYDPVYGHDRAFFTGAAQMKVAAGGSGVGTLTHLAKGVGELKGEAATFGSGFAVRGFSQRQRGAKLKVSFDVVFKMSYGSCTIRFTGDYKR